MIPDRVSILGYTNPKAAKGGGIHAPPIRWGAGTRDLSLDGRIGIGGFLALLSDRHGIHVVHVFSTSAHPLIPTAMSPAIRGIVQRTCYTSHVVMNGGVVRPEKLPSSTTRQHVANGGLHPGRTDLEAYRSLMPCAVCGARGSAICILMRLFTTVVYNNLIYNYA
jgi:hypothetical protein